MMEVEKNKLGYSFKRIDPFPHVWTHVNWFFLYKDKEHKELYKSDEKDAMHLERQSYRVCRIVFDEKYKSLTNDINYYILYHKMGYQINGRRNPQKQNQEKEPQKPPAETSPAETPPGACQDCPESGQLS